MKNKTKRWKETANYISELNIFETSKQNFKNLINRMI